MTEYFERDDKFEMAGILGEGGTSSLPKSEMSGLLREDSK